MGDFKKAYDLIREGNIVQYSHRVLGAHETSLAD
jgi:hypothetical protein